MRSIWIPQLIVSIMLVWALNPENPYAYYVLLRWILCPVFAYLAIKSFSYHKEDWVWLLGVTAAIYNPIIPLHLTREIWSVINIITIGIAVGSIFSMRKWERRLQSERAEEYRTRTLEDQRKDPQQEALKEIQQKHPHMTPAEAKWYLKYQEEKKKREKK